MGQLSSDSTPGVWRSPNGDFQLEDGVISSAKYLFAHGSLLIGAAACNAMDAAESFGMISLHKFSSSVLNAGNALFAYANFIALEENLRIYALAKESAPDDKAGSWLKHAAMFGILSNIGYITSTACVLFGASTAISVLIGLLSACCGGIKILCDIVANFQ